MESFVVVIQFLANIPLLQRLPSSSIDKIAQLVQYKHYKVNEYVVREGETGDGIYFIWQGEAKVHGYNNVFKVEDRSLERRLKPYDYFGHGDLTSCHEADIMALTKLTCLVLLHEHSSLLQPKSIWTADETHKASLMERILHLEPIEVNIFRGITLPDTPRTTKVFGGQMTGQACFCTHPFLFFLPFSLVIICALAAAIKTVDCGKLVHSLHNYFLLAGELDMPIVYQVHRLRDGNSFATRRVDALQKGNVIFTLLASFQKEEIGFEHQEVTMPSAPAPDTLLSMEELRQRSYSDPRLPGNYRSKVVIDPWPVDMRFYEPTGYLVETKTPGSLSFWLKAQGELSDDPGLHRCVAAFISDLILIAVSLKPHGKKGVITTFISLDHTMWFHRSFRADEWLLYVIESPSASSGRGFCSAKMYNQKGQLVVSLIQEGLIRKAKAQQPVAKSNL
ncbi:hypothetical protein MKW94_014067 [Papaver nudicaule]|uniref:Cyclic nucleotide-binding domain-containing protein n=1 Tax=Papaver nudicaule TaxID=74823 RepID=A0AA41RP98_PAPNU|nr:hypothetical protein [Papaver nudicaule]